MFGYGSIPKLTHGAYENIPKSEKKIQILFLDPKKIQSIFG